jgi:hypothetical protein
MKYYVPVGPGGVFFRVAMAVTGIMGSLVYWQASRRRAVASQVELLSPGDQRGSAVGWPETYGAIAAGSRHTLSASRSVASAAIRR